MAVGKTRKKDNDTFKGFQATKFYNSRGVIRQQFKDTVQESQQLDLLSPSYCKPSKYIYLKNLGVIFYIDWPCGGSRDGKKY